MSLRDLYYLKGYCLPFRITVSCLQILGSGSPLFFQLQLFGLSGKPYSLLICPLIAYSFNKTSIRCPCVCFPNSTRQNQSLSLWHYLCSSYITPLLCVCVITSSCLLYLFTSVAISITRWQTCPPTTNSEPPSNANSRACLQFQSTFCTCN